VEWLKSGNQTVGNEMYFSFAYRGNERVIECKDSRFVMANLKQMQGNLIEFPT